MSLTLLDFLLNGDINILTKSLSLTLDELTHFRSSNSLYPWTSSSSFAFSSVTFSPLPAQLENATIQTPHSLSDQNLLSLNRQGVDIQPLVVSNNLIANEKTTFSLDDEGKLTQPLSQLLAAPQADMLAISSYQSPIVHSSSPQIQFVVPSTSLTTAQTTTTGPKIYYISPTGNDNNTGASATSAWKSLSKINSLDLNPGDRVLLQGGYTYSGNLNFTQEDAGTATAPITIGSYGTGRARIDAGAGTGISVYNAGGYQMKNLDIVGSGTGTNTKDGISFYNDLANNTMLDYINIKNVNVSKFGRNGIAIGSWNQNSGYRNVSITNVQTHHNGDTGLKTYAQRPNVHENIYVGYVKAYNNSGIVGSRDVTGNGILLGNINGGTIERSVAYSNGGLDNIGPGGGVGIWTFDSNKVTIQYNESYNNHTGNGDDGDGFDFDQNVSNSVMQYNYSHDNDGSGYLLCQLVNNASHTNNIVRYNISQNDGRNNSKNRYAGIHVAGLVTNAQIYNNTVYMTSVSSGSPTAVRIQSDFNGLLKPAEVFLRNNIFQTNNGISLLHLDKGALARTTDVLFQGNNYYTTGTPFKISFNGTTYSDLNSWRTATGQERLNGLNVGMSIDPLLTNPGGGKTIGNPDLLNSLSAYRLGSTSPLINQGLNLNQLFGINPGTQDFYGTALPQRLGYDIGAAESF